MNSCRGRGYRDTDYNDDDNTFLCTHRDRQRGRQRDRQTDRDRGSRQRERKGERDTLGRKREIFHTWVQVDAG